MNRDWLLGFAFIFQLVDSLDKHPRTLPMTRCGIILACCLFTATLLALCFFFFFFFFFWLSRLQEHRKNSPQLGKIFLCAYSTRRHGWTLQSEKISVRQKTNSLDAMVGYWVLQITWFKALSAAAATRRQPLEIICMDTCQLGLLFLFQTSIASTR